MIERRFGESAPFSIGVEEELMILDGETLALAPRVDDLVRGARGRGLPGELKTELFATLVELSTGVCADAGEALAALAELRRVASHVAAEHGLRLAAAGTHPFSVPEQQPVVADYEAFVRYAGVSARRQGVQGLHVHVGMPSSEACFRALEGVLPWLPLVLALAANSPYLAGVETGLASNRAELLAQLPRAGAPPAFRAYDEWEAWVEGLVALGVADDYTRFWWDVRPHPRFGTLELRVADQPTALERTACLVELFAALCRAALEWPPRRYDPPGRGVYAQNRWAALRFGPRAELVHPDGGRVAPVAELAEDLAALTGVELPRDCEGDRQLEVGRAEGLRAVCADLVARTSVPSA